MKKIRGSQSSSSQKMTTAEKILAWGAVAGIVLVFAVRMGLTTDPALPSTEEEIPLGI